MTEDYWLKNPYKHGKKIRGWKRRKKQIDAWKREYLHLDKEALKKYGRDYVKFWIAPFDSLIKLTPPKWYQKYALEAFLEIYDSWFQEMRGMSQDFYLKLWLYEPYFEYSQVVVAYDSMLNFYDNVFEKETNSQEFPLDLFPSLKDKLEKFDWEQCIDGYYLDDDDIDEKTHLIDNGLRGRKDIIAHAEKEVITFGKKQYFIKNGYVWVGTLRK